MFRGTLCEGSCNTVERKLQNKKMGEKKEKGKKASSSDVRLRGARVGCGTESLMFSLKVMMQTVRRSLHVESFSHIQRSWELNCCVGQCASRGLFSA